ncbi:MAG: isochorismatase family protein [Clostridia bacterium]|nr:isochorismatase family protein [Clostridia bacterium]
MKSIIIVDMQKGFINENNIHLIDKINKYLIENKFDNIIYTKCINKEGSSFDKILNWKEMLTKDEQEICINKLDKGIILEKYGYGLLNEHIKKLKDLGITEIEVCGTDSDACVLAISYQLFDNGIRPILLKKLCASSSRKEEINNFAFNIMERSFGKENIID